jgi:hypothetical protein
VHRTFTIPLNLHAKSDQVPVSGEQVSDVVAAPGWAAVYVRDGREFAWPLIAWLRLPAGPGPLMVGLALSPDGRKVVQAEQIEGFRCYLPPAEWVADDGEPAAPRPPGS